MFQKIKPHLKWVIPLVVIVILLVLFVVSENRQVISATVSPEAIVKGQNQEITVTAVVKPKGFIPPVIFVTLSEPKKVEDYNTFKGKTAWLGLLKKSTKDNSGNYIYQRTFNLNHSKAETVQVRLRNLVGFFIYPTVQTDSTTVWPITLPTLRLAVSTRSFSLPQDPGEEGKKTLAGIDSDNDGVRDDIQREIFFAFPESERLRMAINLGIKGMQRQFEEPVDSEKIYKGYIEAEKAGKCIEGLLRVFNTNSAQKSRYYNGSYAKNTENILVNTYPRLKLTHEPKIVEIVSEAVNQFERDYVFGTPEESNCTFNWQSLPD